MVYISQQFHEVNTLFIEPIIEHYEISENNSKWDMMKYILKIYKYQFIAIILEG